MAAAQAAEAEHQLWLEELEVLAWEERRAREREDALAGGQHGGYSCSPGCEGGSRQVQKTCSGGHGGECRGCCAHR